MINPTNTPTPTTDPLAHTPRPAAPAAPAKAPRKLRDAVPADKHGWWWGTGRRKTAVARVRIRLAKDGKSSFVVNSPAKEGTPVEKFFNEERDRNDATAALKLTNTEGKFQIVAQVHGGGFMGQAGAVLLGVSRALRNYDPSLEQALRDAGFLTRDAREVERKKYGQAGARRRFQFSKR
jgi:small subunit ribosomal protein S9